MTVDWLGVRKLGLAFLNGLAKALSIVVLLCVVTFVTAEILVNGNATWAIIGIISFFAIVPSFVIIWTAWIDGIDLPTFKTDLLYLYIGVIGIFGGAAVIMGLGLGIIWVIEVVALHAAWALVLVGLLIVMAAIIGPNIKQGGEQK